MINRVQVKNYRCLKEVDVELNHLTVLVGRNGSGKSTFLDVLRLIRDGLRNGLENAIIDRRGFASIRRWSRNRPNQVEITLTVKRNDFWGRYSITLGSDGDSYRVKAERGEFKGSDASVQDAFERKGDKWVQLPEGLQSENRARPAPLVEPTAMALPALAIVPGFYRLARMLGGQFYTIFPNTLRDPQKATTERFLQEDGKNFVSILRQISKDREYFPELKAALSQVVEGITDIRVTPAGGFLVAELQHSDIISANNGNDTEKAPWFDLSQESDGTLRMLGMLVALYQRSLNNPISGIGVLALEEPEIALHPGAVAVLCDVMKETTRRRQQIILTTQSPDLISSFEPEDLRVVERVGGAAEIGPVDAIQCEVVKEKLFTAGDLVRTEGLRIDRKKIIGNRKASA